MLRRWSNRTHPEFFLRFMKHSRSHLIHVHPGRALAIALWLALGFAGAAGAASPATKSAASAGAPPQAVFVMPRSPKEGTDPFFPRSKGPYERYQVIPKVTSAQPVVVTAELRLNGISGSADRRLAIINNRTFEVGEEADIISGSDRVRIRVLEIKGDSVIAQFVAGGVRKELRLRKGL